MRAGKYTKADIESISNQARGQRLAKLRISLWKYLKSNLAMHLTHWSVFKKTLEKVKIGLELLEFAHKIIDLNQDFIVHDTLNRVQDLFIKEDKLIGVEATRTSAVQSFLKKCKPQWRLHYKITQEVLELFVSSPDFQEIRHRLLCCLCIPNSLEAVEGLMDLDMESREWRERFLSYLTLEICMVFISVNWIEIFKD